jgi:hypothetical protein
LYNTDQEVDDEDAAEDDYGLGEEEQPEQEDVDELDDEYDGDQGGPRRADYDDKMALDG